MYTLNATMHCLQKLQMWLRSMLRLYILYVGPDVVYVSTCWWCVNTCECNPLTLHPYMYMYIAGGVDADQKFIDVRMRAVGRKILILSGKGGQYCVATMGWEVWR